MSVTIYEDEEWSAVYLDGKLQRVGDSYLADEWVRSHYGIETVQSADFLRGGTQRADVAPTLEALEEYRRDRESREARAAELRAEADRLLGLAQECDG